MIMTFKTKRNSNGNISFLAIDTERREYSRQYARISEVIDAMEIKSADLKKLRDQASADGYAEKDFI